MNVARDARGVQFASRESDRGERRYTVGRNFQGSIQGAYADVSLSVLGSVQKGSSLVTGGNAAVNVARNFDGVVDVNALQFRVQGNVAKDSRIVAGGVREWQTDFNSLTPQPNFFVGGRLDGIVNVGVFDASPGDITVTILGGAPGSRPGSTSAGSRPTRSCSRATSRATSGRRRISWRISSSRATSTGSR